MRPLIDRWGRRITRLRIAVSDRCNLRCLYCRPRSGGAAAGRARPLSADEIAAIAEAAVACGMDGIRLTGGEPLLREDLREIVCRLSHLTAGLDLSLTTNGLLLAEQAQPLAQAGLKRVNVSLDSLRRERFDAMTNGDSLAAVTAGLRAAVAAGLWPIKLNVVVVRGLNDDEVVGLVRFARENGYHVRFIEFMPLDGGCEWHPRATVSSDEVRARIEEEFDLQPLPDGSSPGDEYLLEAGPTRVSFIGTITHPFCGRCSRLRVTADGFLRACLFSLQEQCLRPALSAPRPKEALAAAFAAAAACKPQGHRIGQAGFVRPARSMFSIGG